MLLVQGHPINPAKAMGHLPLDEGLFADLVLPGALFNLLKKGDMVSRLDAQNKAHIQRLQQANMRGIGREGILNDDDFEMGVFPTDRQQQAFSRVAFAVVLGRSILPSNRLGPAGSLRVDRDGRSPPPRVDDNR